MTNSEALIAIAVFSMVMSHAFYMLKWLHGVMKASNARYRNQTLSLIEQQIKDA